MQRPSNAQHSERERERVFSFACLGDARSGKTVCREREREFSLPYLADAHSRKHFALSGERERETDRHREGGGWSESIFRLPYLSCRLALELRLRLHSARRQTDGVGVSGGGGIGGKGGGGQSNTVREKDFL